MPKDQKEEFQQVEKKRAEVWRKILAGEGSKAVEELKQEINNLQIGSSIRQLMEILLGQMEQILKAQSQPPIPQPFDKAPPAMPLPMQPVLPNHQQVFKEIASLQESAKSMLSGAQIFDQTGKEVSQKDLAAASAEPKTKAKDASTDLVISTKDEKASQSLTEKLKELYQKFSEIGLSVKAPEKKQEKEGQKESAPQFFILSVPASYEGNRDIFTISQSDLAKMAKAAQEQREASSAQNMLAFAVGSHLDTRLMLDACKAQRELFAKELSQKRPLGKEVVVESVEPLLEVKSKAR